VDSIVSPLNLYCDNSVALWLRIIEVEVKLSTLALNI